MKEKEINMLQLFAGEYDNGAYCDFSSSTAKAVAGKDILLAIYNLDGSKLLAVSGQQGLTINRSADSIEITSKDTKGGWKSKIAGMKEWSIDNDGLYMPDDESHSILSEAFENSDPVCLKVINGKKKIGMFGGLAVITDYPIEAPYDDAMTYSLTLEGMGALFNLARQPAVPDTMPEESATLGVLTVVSVAGANAGETSVYINPEKGLTSKYFYQAGDSISYPVYGQDCTGMNTWNGTDPLTLTTGQKIMVVECTADNKARKAGMATVTAKA